MSDDQTVSGKQPLLLNAPPAPAIETTATVTEGTSDVQPKVSTINKILGAARKIFTKHGLEFRPPTASSAPDLQQKNPDPVVEPPQTPPPISGATSGPAPQPLVDEIFAAECIEGCLRGFISMRDAGLLSLAVKITADKPWSREQIGRISPTDAEIKNFVRNVIVVLKKWNVSLTWLPELSVLMDIIRVEMRYRAFVRELRDIVEAREKAEKAKGGGAA